MKKSRSKKKRLGRVRICVSYVVDMDDKAMVDHAKDALYEDIYCAMIKSQDSFDPYMEVVEDDKAKEEDIEEFLLDPLGNDL